MRKRKMGQLIKFWKEEREVLNGIFIQIFKRLLQKIAADKVSKKEKYTEIRNQKSKRKNFSRHLQHQTLSIGRSGNLEHKSFKNDPTREIKIIKKKIKDTKHYQEDTF